MGDVTNEKKIAKAKTFSQMFSFSGYVKNLSNIIEQNTSKNYISD